MSSAVAMLLLIIPAFFFYSPTVEKNRVVTIQRAIVITQERKTPAYYLYQQAQNNEAPPISQPAMTTYLSTQSYIPNEEAVAVTEMKVSRREVASEVDAGFQSENKAPIVSTVLNESYANSAINFTAEEVTPTPSPSKKWATVRGKFELIEGVGIVDHFIELKRIEEGQVREVGKIDLKAGTYSIDIESPQGFLVAKITDRSGTEIGTDQERIINLQSRGAYFEGPFIRVGRPATIAANPDIPAVASATRLRGLGRAPLTRPAFATTFFSNQHTLDNPTDAYSNISRNSSSVAHVVDVNLIYKTMVSIRQTSDETETPLFTNKWVQGVLAYISDQQKIEFKSQSAPILLGRVLVNNKPVTGAQVQIENHPSIYPIYFDHFMIPNFKQTETSENGYFMFVGLEEEAYTVAAFKQNKMLGYQMFVAEEDAISFQNIISSPAPRSAIARTFDAFTGAPVETDLIIPDIEEIVQTTLGTSAYRTNNTAGVAIFLARSNETNYLPIRYFQDARKDFAHIPMLQEAWLKQMQKSKLINDVPETGMIVGFVPELHYEMYLARDGYSKENVVYFDQHGLVVAAPVVGGGFVLFNVPMGVNEVIVQEKNSDRIFSQVFEVRINQVSAAHFSE